MELNREEFFKNGLGDVWTTTYNEATRIILMGKGYNDFMPAMQRKMIIDLKPINGRMTVKEIAERLEIVEEYNKQYEIHKPYIEEEMEKLFIKLYKKCEAA
ncbi:MAG: hypothetical protein GY787_10590 [Alteromonadales bacterium]|nr:hypothetical protein [Alteromonadales bacterium]